MRTDTPWSQLETEFSFRIDAAFLERTMKVAWKASSASWAFPRTRRQIPITRGPCRETSSEKAVSSRSETKRSRSARSVAASDNGHLHYRVPPPRSGNAKFENHFAPRERGLRG